MVQRIFNLPKSNSFFLFGPRGVGKSTLLEQEYASLGTHEKLEINLLDDEVFVSFLKHPNRLKEEVEARKQELKWVLIDEIQKIPPLLDICHLLIERHKKIKFALTGSSARKLKRGQANLLAGRAFSFYLHPFTFQEAKKINSKITDLDYIAFGGLPKVFSFAEVQDRRRFLLSYVQTYLKEEILAEQLVRNVTGFRRFLEVAAQMNTEILNYDNMSRDVGIDDKTVANYFQILQDTMIGTLLEPFHLSSRKRQKRKPKFYLFDTGVTRAMDHSLSQVLYASTGEFGRLFEQMIVNQILRLNDYHEKNWSFFYLRMPNDLEIDLIIKKQKDSFLLVEIKSAELIKDSHLTGLRKLSLEFPKAQKLVLCREKIERVTEDGIQIFPWQRGIDLIFG